jgi:hypothetical protein
MTIVVAVIVVFLLIVGLLLATGFRPQKSRSGRTRTRAGGGNKGGTGL